MRKGEYELGDGSPAPEFPSVGEVLGRGRERFAWKRLLYEMGFMVGGLVTGTMLGLSAGAALSGPESIVSMLTMAGGGLTGAIAGDIVATRLVA